MNTDAVPLLSLTNGCAVPLESIPCLSPAIWAQAILDGVAAGQRVAACFGVPTADPNRSLLYVVLADDASNGLLAGRMVVEGDRFESLTPRCPQMHLFEREIAEQLGLKPSGHPWLKPVRFHRVDGARDAWNRTPDAPLLPGVTDFYRVEGDQVHEVAVGPVHAGVIEPGHFRFQCHGEEVFHLEIALGYQHRGGEDALRGAPHARALPIVETLAGDSTLAHASTYCQVLEALAGTATPARAQVLRGIALELERLANHIGDLGALAGDVGYLPTSSYCGRIRGDVLNATAVLCGNRFGRGLVRPGGAGFDLDAARIAELQRRIAGAEADASAAINLLWDSPSVMARFESTGPLPLAVATELGVVGPAARASGLSRDSRRDQPAGIFRLVQVPVSSYSSGDVFARAFVRGLEIQQSFEFVREQLSALPAGAIRAETGPLAPDSLSVALNEGWRGEVCHVGLTDARGRFARYKVVDPSFHNWSALAYVLRGQAISDFPLCNKSFNLSYCGHDL